MSDAFQRAWDFVKAENHLYYNVHVTPQTPEEAEKLRLFERQWTYEGISYDSGGLVGSGGGGRDMHFDFSLKGATPDEMLERLDATGIPYQVEMIASEIPPLGTDERYEYDREDMKRYDKEMEEKTGRPYFNGYPYSEAEEVGEHPCWQCAQYGEHTMAGVIREGIQDDHVLSLNCSSCGLMDMGWGEDNPELAAKYNEENL